MGYYVSGGSAHACEDASLNGQACQAYKSKRCHKFLGRLFAKLCGYQANVEIQK